MTDQPKGKRVFTFVARPRFHGIWTPIVLAIMCVAAFGHMFIPFTPLMHTIVGASVMLWVWLTMLLDKTACRLFNTKEHFRLLLNEASDQLELAVKQGFIMENNLEEEGTSQGDTSLKEDSSEEGDVDGNK